MEQSGYITKRGNRAISDIYLAVSPGASEIATLTFRHDDQVHSPQGPIEGI